jgi:putative transcriptional regulator
VKPPVHQRQETLSSTATLLKQAGFFLVDLHTVRPSCFDLLARRDSALLLIKVLKNVDALNDDNANALSTMAWMMHGTPIIVGSISGTQSLEAGVVYTRYGLTILTYETLEDFLLNGVPPFLFSSPGGIFARIDGRKLREIREETQLSLGAVADAVGVSRRTIQLYEEGGGADVDIVERLETFFGITLVTPLNPFEEKGPVRAKEPHSPEKVDSSGKDSLTRTVVAELGGQGWKITVTTKNPFDALARHQDLADRDLVVIGMGDIQNAEKRARRLHDIARVAEGWSLFVVPERKEKENIEGTALVAYRELKRHRDPEDLFELIEERTTG